MDVKQGELGRLEKLNFSEFFSSGRKERPGCKKRQSFRHIKGHAERDLKIQTDKPKRGGERKPRKAVGVVVTYHNPRNKDSSNKRIERKKGFIREILTDKTHNV